MAKVCFPSSRRGLRPSATVSPTGGARQTLLSASGSFGSPPPVPHQQPGFSALHEGAGSDALDGGRRCITLRLKPTGTPRPNLRFVDGVTVVLYHRSVPLAVPERQSTQFARKLEGVCRVLLSYVATSPDLGAVWVSDPSVRDTIRRCTRKYRKKSFGTEGCCCWVWPCWVVCR
jgi:hypothetical protein